MLSSLVSMLPCSMVGCAEGEGETALIDQRAVAAGKNFTTANSSRKELGSFSTLHPVTPLVALACGTLLYCA